MEREITNITRRVLIRNEDTLETTKLKNVASTIMNVIWKMRGRILKNGLRSNHMGKSGRTEKFRLVSARMPLCRYKNFHDKKF